MKSVSLVLSVVICSLVFLNIKAQVLGIDFGTQFWKASMISPGKNLVIVQNSRSQRKTHNSIAFHQGVRYFQSESVNKRLKKPKASHFYLNRLIRSLDLQQPHSTYKYENGTYWIQEEDKILTLEQVVGMILRNLKSLATIQSGSDIKDCVITVPANWGPKARMSLVNAASIAQLSVLGLINENSAAALHFSISRNDTDPINMLIFNLGSNNLQISIIKLFGTYDENKNKTIQSIEALGHHVVDNVGGLLVDEHITNYLAKQFSLKHKIDPKSKIRSHMKLLDQSGQAKQILSANKELTVYVQQLIEGLDLQLPLKREVIEQIQFFNHIPDYISETLKKANLQKKDISFVQLIGGASRIPRITNIIKEQFTEIEVGAHMNGDQAMAYGSALRAANLSIAMRVKELYFYDNNLYSTKVVVSTPEKGVIRQEALFSQKDYHGFKKIMNFMQNDQDMKITIYNNQNNILREYVTSNLTDWKNKFQNVTDSPLVVLTFACHSVTFAELKQAHVQVGVNVSQIKEVIEYVEQQVKNQSEQTNKQEQKTEQKQQQKQEQKKQAQEQKQKQEQKRQEQKGEQAINKQTNDEQANKEQTKTENKDESAQANKSDNNNSTQKNKDKKSKKAKATKTIKKKVQTFSTVFKKHIVKLTETNTLYPKLSKEQAQRYRETIKKFEQHQQYLRDKGKIRNQLQSTLYSIKDNYQADYMVKFSKPQELANLKQTVSKQLLWLQQNAWTADKQAFEQHFNNLYKSYEPMYNRTQQYRHRQKTYNESMSFLSATYLKTEQLNFTHQWLGERIQQHLKKINDTVYEINERIKKQISMPLNENPVIFNHEMIKLAQGLRDDYYLLKLIPRPRKTFTAEEPKHEEKATNQEQYSEDEKAEQKDEGEEAKENNENTQKNQEETNQQQKQQQQENQQQNAQSKKQQQKAEDL